MKTYVKVGNYIFDYIFLSILIALSFVLVLPFYAVFVGAIGFYDRDSSIKQMFIIIKENIKNILFLTIIILLIAASIASIYLLAFNGISLWFLQVIKYVLIGILIFIFIYPPIIMIKMNVTFKNMMQNSFYILLSQFKLSLALIGLTILLIVGIYIEIWLILLIIPWIQGVSYLSSKALENEKNKKGERKNEENSN